MKKEQKNNIPTYNIVVFISVSDNLENPKEGERGKGTMEEVMTEITKLTDEMGFDDEIQPTDESPKNSPLQIEEENDGLQFFDPALDDWIAKYQNPEENFDSDSLPDLIDLEEQAKSKETERDSNPKSTVPGNCEELLKKIIPEDKIISTPFGWTNKSQIHQKDSREKRKEQRRQERSGIAPARTLEEVEKELQGPEVSDKESSHEGEKSRQAHREELKAKARKKREELEALRKAGKETGARSKKRVEEKPRKDKWTLCKSCDKFFREQDKHSCRKHVQLQVTVRKDARVHRKSNTSMQRKVEEKTMDPSDVEWVLCQTCDLSYPKGEHQKCDSLGLSERDDSSSSEEENLQRQKQRKSLKQRIVNVCYVCKAEYEWNQHHDCVLVTTEDSVSEEKENDTSEDSQDSDEEKTEESHEVESNEEERESMKDKAAWVCMKCDTPHSSPEHHQCEEKKEMDPEGNQCPTYAPETSEVSTEEISGETESGEENECEQIKPTCNECGEKYDQSEGHAECKKKDQRAIKHYEDVRPCSPCGQYVHKSGNCPTWKKVHERTICFNCGERGHNVSTCTAWEKLKDLEEQPKEEQKSCHHCGTRGHTAGNCEQWKKLIGKRSITCLVCHSLGHSAEYCPRMKKYLSKKNRHEKKTDGSPKRDHDSGSSREETDLTKPIPKVKPGSTPKPTINRQGRKIYDQQGEKPKFGRGLSDREIDRAVVNSMQGLELQRQYDILRTLVDKRWIPEDHCYRARMTYLPEIHTIIFDSSGTFHKVDAAEYYADLGYNSVDTRAKTEPKIAHQKKIGGLLIVNISGFQPGTTDPVRFHQGNEILKIMNTLITIHRMERTESTLAFYFVMGSQCVLQSDLGNEEIFMTYYHWIDRNVAPSFKGRVCWIGTGRVAVNEVIKNNMRGLRDAYGKFVRTNGNVKVTYDDWWRTIPIEWTKNEAFGKIAFPHSATVFRDMMEYIMKHFEYGPMWKVDKNKVETKKEKNASRNRRRTEAKRVHQGRVTVVRDGITKEFMMQGPENRGSGRMINGQWVEGLQNKPPTRQTGRKGKVNGPTPFHVRQQRNLKDNLTAFDIPRNFRTSGGNHQNRRPQGGRMNEDLSGYNMSSGSANGWTTGHQLPKGYTHQHWSQYGYEMPTGQNEVGRNSRFTRPLPSAHRNGGKFWRDPDQQTSQGEFWRDTDY